MKATERIRVCKEYYLHTLDISQRRIEWAHAKAEKETHEDKRGKHKKCQIPDTEIDIIKERINSFPRIPSHYCRKSSKTEYLEPQLSMSKMYQAYVESYKERGIKFKKENIYRQVFDNEFNLSFYIPKKDRCDTCEEYKAIVQNGFDDSKTEANNKLKLKTMKIQNDRKKLQRNCRGI